MYIHKNEVRSFMIYTTKYDTNVILGGFMAIVQEIYDDSCPLGSIQRVVGGKWKIGLLWALRQTKRFNELHKQFNGITQTMLTKQLRELEADGFVHREIFREVPPRVEYSLTKLGIDFLPVIKQMVSWAEDNYELLK